MAQHGEELLCIDWIASGSKPLRNVLFSVTLLSIKIISTINFSYYCYLPDFITDIFMQHIFCFRYKLFLECVEVKNWYKYFSSILCITVTEYLDGLLIYSLLFFRILLANKLDLNAFRLRSCWETQVWYTILLLFLGSYDLSWINVAISFSVATGCDN